MKATRKPQFPDNNAPVQIAPTSFIGTPSEKFDNYQAKQLSGPRTQGRPTFALIALTRQSARQILAIADIIMKIDQVTRWRLDLEPLWYTSQSPRQMQHNPME